MQVDVETTAGKLQGFSDGAVATFLGIPYGEGPAGRQRFRPALPATPWSGIREAVRFGPLAPQNFGSLDYPWGGYIGALNQSEDCLTLNVWAPAEPRSEGSLPVLCWIHGGGFENGSPAMLVVDGAELARHADVVVVSITHRLNVFGYLFLGGIAGYDYRESANVGQLDLVLALEWVRANIAGFGGDPHNVTVFGQSGGAVKIGCLMAMPAARGLFRRVVMQSGVRLVGPSLERADDYARRYLRQLGLADQRWVELLEFSPERLVHAYAELRDPALGRDLLEPGPVVDGAVLPKAPLEALAGGFAADVPLMIGHCRDEMNIVFSSLRVDPMPELRYVDGDQMLQVYLACSPQAPREDVAKRLITDWKYRMPAVVFAEAQLAAGQLDVYMYVFEWQSSVMPELGATHGLDVPFFFGTTARLPITSADPSSSDLAARMGSALVAFARSGDPNHEALPHWPRYTESRRSTMTFDRATRIEDDPRPAERRAWNHFPTARLGA